MAEIQFCLSPLARPSVPKSVRSSFLGCPAPTAREVLQLAKFFPSLGVVAVRPSSRSFSSWVAVCSFKSSEAAKSFSDEAAAQLLSDQNCFCVVRQVGRRYRVSVPCLNPPLVALRRRRGVKLGGYRVQIDF